MFRGLVGLVVWGLRFITIEFRGLGFKGPFRGDIAGGYMERERERGGLVEGLGINKVSLHLVIVTYVHICYVR